MSFVAVVQWIQGSVTKCPSLMLYHNLKERNDTSIVGAAWRYQGVYCSKSGMHGCCRCCSGLWTTDSICTVTPRSRPTPWHNWPFLVSLVSQSTMRTMVTASWHPPMWVSPIVFSWSSSLASCSQSYILSFRLWWWELPSFPALVCSQTPWLLQLATGGGWLVGLFVNKKKQAWILSCEPVWPNSKALGW